MSGQIQKAASTQTQRDHDKAVAAVNLQNPELTEDVEDLLAEIDDVLEENAEEFVKSYVQQGGE
jgi:prokaryotic ubiquitin-like protein Pup